MTPPVPILQVELPAGQVRSLATTSAHVNEPVDVALTVERVGETVRVVSGTVGVIATGGIWAVIPASVQLPVRCSYPVRTKIVPTGEVVGDAVRIHTGLSGVGFLDWPAGQVRFPDSVLSVALLQSGSTVQVDVDAVPISIVTWHGGRVVRLPLLSKYALSIILTYIFVAPTGTTTLLVFIVFNWIELMVLFAAFVKLRTPSSHCDIELFRKENVPEVEINLMVFPATASDTNVGALPSLAGGRCSHTHWLPKNVADLVTVLFPAGHTKSIFPSPSLSIPSEHCARAALSSLVSVALVQPGSAG
jgi:hypothetical protein